MNRIYSINNKIQTFVWGGQFKYSIILKIKNNLYKVGKLNKRLVF